MRQNLSSFKMVNTYEDLVKDFASPNREVTEILEVGTDSLLVGTRALEHLAEPMPNLNLLLASFTTAHARLRLFHFMEMVADKCGGWESIIYCDTQGIILLKIAKQIVFILIFFILAGRPIRGA